MIVWPGEIFIHRSHVKSFTDLHGKIGDLAFHFHTDSEISRRSRIKPASQSSRFRKYALFIHVINTAAIGAEAVKRKIERLSRLNSFRLDVCHQIGTPLSRTLKRVTSKSHFSRAINPLKRKLVKFRKIAVEKLPRNATRSFRGNRHAQGQSPRPCGVLFEGISAGIRNNVARLQIGKACKVIFCRDTELDSLVPSRNRAVPTVDYAVFGLYGNGTHV